MSDLFKRLPGFQQTPAGQERQILRALPKIWLVGSALLCLPALAARWWQAAESAQTLAAPLSTLEIYAISLLVLHWTVVFTVAIGAFIVMVMKGPAYVADAYPMQGMDRPDVPLPTGPTSTEKGAMKP